MTVGPCAAANRGAGVKHDPYPCYRDSSVEWLGEVPEHWEITRLGRVVTCLDGRRIPLNAEERANLQGDYPYWGANGVLDHLEEWIFDEPLVLLGEDGAPFFAPNKCVAFSVSGKIWVNNHAHVLRPTGVQQEFLTHLLNITEYAAFIDGSTRDKLTQGEMNGIPIPLPPLDEQRTIAAFLDRETERIDALVAKNRLLIERLEEYRTALITRTVTRGLPPEAARAAGMEPSPRLKPSGVEWLGEVPEHWEVKRLEHVASYRTSSVDKRTEDGELPVRLCNYTDVYYQDRIRASSSEFMEATASAREIVRFKLCAGDVLITKDSEDWQDIAVPALIDETAEDFLCGYHLGIIRPGPTMHPAFMLRALQSVAVNRQLQTSASGVTRYGLPNAAVTEALVPLPPPDEQRTIAAFLDRETERIDALFGKKRLLIERLEEYRTALITASVTGKIDVREPPSDQLTAK